jgi:hypothetical protein
VIGIECGQHEDSSSYENALECALEFCKNIVNTDETTEIQESVNKEAYRAETSLSFPKGYCVVRDFHEFEKIEKNTLL